jgi:hypothetical protein
MVRSHAGTACIVILYAILKLADIIMYYAFPVIRVIRGGRKVAGRGRSAAELRLRE